MAYTEYKFDKDAIKALVAERAAGLRANRGFSNLLGFGLGVVAERLQKDPRRYRDYGPYWWALKDALKTGGYELGDQSDPLIHRAYQGETAEETLIMADEFRTAYQASNIIYTNQIMLDADSPDYYTLFDKDMEFPAA
jgi:hypothetical protein